MYPARLPFRFWMVGMALIFFIAGAFFRVSAAPETVLSITNQSSQKILLLSLICFTMVAGALCLVDFYRKHHSASYKKLHKNPQRGRRIK